MKFKFLVLSLLCVLTINLSAQEGAAETTEKAAEAAADATAEATTDAESAAAKYNDGLAALKAKEYEKASGLLDEALASADAEADADIIKLAKQNGAIAAYYMGNDLLKGKAYDKAMAAFEKGAELNPAQYVNIYGKAKVYAAQKKPTETVKACYEAYEAAKAAGKEEAGKKYLKTGYIAITKAYSAKDYDEVVEAGNAYLAGGDETADVHYYLAKSLMKKGDASAAVPHGAKAAEMGGAKKEGKYIYAHAEALEAAGQNSAAAAAYGKVPAGKYKESAAYKAGSLK